MCLCGSFGKIGQQDPVFRQTEYSFHSFYSSFYVFSSLSFYLIPVIFFLVLFFLSIFLYFLSSLFLSFVLSFIRSFVLFECSFFFRIVRYFVNSCRLLIKERKSEVSIFTLRQKQKN